MVQPELQTVYALLHDYPAPQGKAIRFLWDKSTAVSLFLQVESNDLQSAKLCVSVESFLVPTIHTVYESASCHFTLAVFMDVLMKLLKDMNLS